MTNSPFAKPTKSEYTCTVPDFISSLIEYRTIVKLTHWSQPDKTDATHLALDEIYNDLEDLIDSLVEKYQGIYNILDLKIPELKSTKDPLKLTQSMYDCIKKERCCIEESFLQNIIDEIVAVIAKGLYKLKYVKSNA